MPRLNLGSGIYTIEGFDNLDPTINGWRYEDGLPYTAGTVEAITEAHSLMFVALADWPFVFSEFYRVLEPGGVVRIAEDSTDDPESERFGGHHDAVTLTTRRQVAFYLTNAGFTAADADHGTMFKDETLIQRLHGAPPKVFAVEGLKPMTL